jgi:hypothetical protein
VRAWAAPSWIVASRRPADRRSGADRRRRRSDDSGSVGAAAEASLAESCRALEAASVADPALGDLLERTRARAASVGLYREAYRARYLPVHECVFTVLALESEPVDPRL